MLALTDELWLAAHDGVKGRLLIGDWSLGVGLAAGLLTELIRNGLVELEDGELFRDATARTRDLALGPLLAQMEIEERDSLPAFSPPSYSARVRARVPVYGAWSPPSTPERRFPAQPVPEENWHRRSGLPLNDWLSYLAYEHRAEALVTRRLARGGRAVRKTSRRLFGSAGPWFVPRDSVVAGNPAASINEQVRRGLELDVETWLLVGLFLATGVHLHAFATLESAERTWLSAQVAHRMPEQLWELLKAAEAAVGQAAMRKR